MPLKISITYCKVWHYTERATSLAAELLREFEAEIETITLIPSTGGRFEITVNGNLLYSKIRTGRHIEKGEAARLINEFITENHN